MFDEVPEEVMKYDPEDGPVYEDDSEVTYESNVSTDSTESMKELTHMYDGDGWVPYTKL